MQIIERTEQVEFLGYSPIQGETIKFTNIDEAIEAKNTRKLDIYEQITLQLKHGDDTVVTIYSKKL